MTPRSLTRFFLIAAVVSATLFAGTGTALACSCMIPNAEALLAESDGAFVGTLIERPQPRIGLSSSSADPAAWVFEVEESYKGDISSPITVISAISGASCGLELSEGDSASLFVHRNGDQWEGNLCSTMGPEALLDASIPPVPFDSTQQSGSALARWVLLSVVLLGFGAFGWNRRPGKNKTRDD